MPGLRHQFLQVDLAERKEELGEDKPRGDNGHKLIDTRLQGRQEGELCKGEVGQGTDQHRYG